MSAARDYAESVLGYPAPTANSQVKVPAVWAFLREHGLGEMTVDRGITGQEGYWVRLTHLHPERGEVRWVRCEDVWDGIVCLVAASMASPPPPLLACAAILMASGLVTVEVVMAQGGEQ